jgi:predicted transcriptional regulator
MAVQSVGWDADTLLEQNRQRLLKELRAVLHAYEARYELPSDRLEAELAAGRIRETEEVCDWLISWHTYQALLRDVPRGS